LCGVQAIVTRDGNDFARSAIPVYTPAKLVQTMAGEKIFDRARHLVRF